MRNNHAFDQHWIYPTVTLFESPLTIRYQQFKAYHELSYPITFFLMGLCKFVLEIALLCGLLFGLVTLVGKLSSGGQPEMLGNMQSGLAASQQVSNESSPVLPAERALLKAEASTQSLLARNNRETATEASAQQKIVVARAKDGLVNESVPAVFNEEWILTRPPQHYVIQLASSPRLDKLLEFSRVLDSENPISIFPFKVSASDELLYGISTGEYSSLDQAMLAVELYPSEARRYQPWVRRLSDLQKDINGVAKRAGRSPL